jgi:hypothetical protein
MVSLALYVYGLDLEQGNCPIDAMRLRVAKRRTVFDPDPLDQIITSYNPGLDVVISRLSFHFPTL